MVIPILVNLWTYVVGLLIVIIILVVWKLGYFSFLNHKKASSKITTEKEIKKKANELIKKEQTLKKQEREIMAQIDTLADEARNLAGVNVHVNEKNENVEKLKAEVTEFKNEICEVKKVLAITDELLEKLPQTDIDEFLQSPEFELYQKIMKKYKLGK